MNREDRLDEILADWRQARDRGEVVRRREVIRAHPELAEDLRARFAVLEILERVTAETGADAEVRADAETEADATDGCRRIGEYRIVREIGRGGMGVVYEAEQTTMRRRVALKVLSRGIADAAQAVKRFEREARAAGRLHHTNIVPVYGMGQAQGTWFYAMELVEGRSLRDVIRELKGPEERTAEQGLTILSGTTAAAAAPGSTTASGSRRSGSASDHATFVRLAEMCAGVAEALEAAHHEGIIHRDVKPSNLLLDEDGVLKLVDFGLARIEDGGHSLTTTGDLLGTPIYMSPEQAMAKRVRIDHRTDIYSLGATLYETLTLSPPFEARNLQTLCSQIITKDPVLPRRTNRRIPRDLETIVLKAMEKDRDRRYESAGEMARDLRRFAEGAAIRARRIGPVGRAWRKVKRHKVRSALAATVLLLVVAGALLAIRGGREETRRIELEYAALCAKGQVGLVHYRWFWSEHQLENRERAMPGELFTRAIALDPDPPDAWLGRALAPDRGYEESLEDLDAARARGLALRTYHLVRAWIYLFERRMEEVEAEEDRADRHPVTGPLDFWLGGMLEAARGRREGALELFTQAVDSAPDGSAVGFLAHHARSRERERDGDLKGALQDLVAVQAGGDSSLETMVRIARLWRRMGSGPRAALMFEDILRRVRSGDSEPEWYALLIACDRERMHDWFGTAAEEAARRHGDSGRILAEWAVTSHNLDDEERVRLLEKAVALDGGSASVHNAHGLVLSRLGHDEEALRAFDRSIECDPGKDAPHLNRGGVFHRQKRYEEALRAFEEAARLQPADPMAHTNRANTLRAMGKHDESLAACARALGIDRLYVLAYFNRALTYGAMDRLEEAVEDYGRALEADATKDHHKRASAHNNRAILLKQLGRPEEALEDYESLRMMDPEVVSRTIPAQYVLNDHAVLLLERGRPRKALEVFRRATQLAPDFYAPQMMQARILNDLGNHEPALAAARRAIEIDGDAHEGLCAFAFALRNLQRNDEALPACRDAIRTREGCHRAHEIHGDVLWRLSHLDEAQAAFKRSFELLPQALLLRKRAHVLVQLHLLEEAAEVYAEAAKLDPRDTRAPNNRGGVLRDLGKIEEALESFDEAIRRDPQNGHAHYNRSLCLDTLGRPEEALEAARLARELLPDDVDASWQVGNLLRKLERPKEAAEAFRGTIALDPRHEPSHHGLGDALFSQEELSDGTAAYERALALGCGSPGVKGRVAWYRATAEEVAERDVARAVELAAEAASKAPEKGWLWTVLGVARYRAGAWTEALEALEKAMPRMDGGNVYAWFHVAMAHSRLGHVEEAKRWYEKAEAGRREESPEDEDLLVLREEAARLLDYEK